MKISEINNPIEKFVAFIAEREAIRIRRFVMKKEWPWTEDEILQQYRFTNVHREDDAVSQHYQKSVRNRYAHGSFILPATVIYRWFNRTTTCDAIFNTGSRSIFELYMNSCDLSILRGCIDKLPPPHVTGAFIITGKPGLPKAEGVLQYIHTWCMREWYDMWKAWNKDPPLLSQMYTEISSVGLGSFMKGQIIADLKYLPFMKNVPDWWIWATPGPGSLKGLNIVYGRPMMTPWHKGEWLISLQALSDLVNPLLAGYGIDKLHNQDLQNCLCEWSKYTKVATGQGRPRQIFRNRAA